MTSAHLHGDSTVPSPAGGEGDAASRLAAMQHDLRHLRSELAGYANLYVSSVRLHGAAERDEVLTVIQEIVISLVGSEEFGIFELRDDADELEASLAFGLDAETVAWVASRPDVVADCIADGRVRVRSEAAPLGPGEFAARLTALVPLRLAGATSGLVAIFSMLPHKPELDVRDHPLLELLASNASTSLHYAELKARFAASAHAGTEP